MQNTALETEPPLLQKSFGLSDEEVIALKNLATERGLNFEPGLLVDLRKRVPDFNADLLQEIFEHPNAAEFLLACDSLPYLINRQTREIFTITTQNLREMLDDSVFWAVFCKSYPSGNGHLGHPSLLKAHISGAFQEAIKKRQPCSDAELIMPFNSAEMYQRRNWAERTGEESGAASDITLL